MKDGIIKGKDAILSDAVKKRQALDSAIA